MKNMQIASRNIIDSIGDTPLIRLDRFLEASDGLGDSASEAKICLYVKLESANPGGSAKDRPAKRMIEDALAKGLINEWSTIVESSSGNMGIGLAQVCRYYGLRFICVVDPYAQKHNLSIIRALGGEIESVTDTVDGNYLAARLSRVKTLANKIEGAYWPNQYANEQNPLSHQDGTIREIDEALDGDFDYLFVATSSTGTARGCRDYLKQMNRRAKVVAVDAVGSRLFGGQAGPRKIPGLGAGRVPELASGQRFDQLQRVTDIDCVVGCRRAALREAMLVGGSAGGVLQTVRSIADQLTGTTCVAILHDSGTRYLDTIFSDDWVEHELGISPSEVERRVQSCASTSTSARNIPLHRQDVTGGIFSLAGSQS